LVPLFHPLLTISNFEMTMKFKNSLLLLCLGLSLFTCVQPVDLEVPNRDDGMVVAANLTTVKGLQDVRLTRLARYDTRALNYPVSAAQVWVVDGGGQRQNYVEDAKNRGWYFPANREFVGEVGKTYVLHILTSDNRKYESGPETVRPIAPIKKVYPEPVVVDDPKLGSAIIGYNILLDTEDSPNKGDYYRWSWVHYEQLVYCRQFEGVPYTGGPETLVGLTCCEPCWDIVRCYRNCTNVLSDALINGKNITRHPIANVAYCARDYYIEIQQRVISREAYNYWKAVDQLSSNNGSLFDTAPAAIRGNIKCISNPEEEAYGLFEASAISENGFFIERTQSAVPAIVTCPPNPVTANPLICAACVEGAFRTKIKPKYWTK